MKRFDPDGKEKRRACKGERRCAGCDWLAWVWTDGMGRREFCYLRQSDPDDCDPDDYAGECAHFTRRG